jgi:hypothetical protein
MSYKKLEWWVRDECPDQRGANPRVRLSVLIPRSSSKKSKKESVGNGISDPYFNRQIIVVNFVLIGLTTTLHSLDDKNKFEATNKVKNLKEYQSDFLKNLGSETNRDIMPRP